MMKMKRFAICTAIAFALLCAGVRQAGALPVISTGTRIPIDATTFALPIDVTGAVQLTSWSVDLNYDPTDVQINTGCDPFSGDIYCSLLFGPFTEGDFFASGAPFNLLNPGFVEQDPTTLEQTGVMFGFNGAYGGIPPAPSGDGVLGFVEFTVLGNGDSTITVTNPTVTSAVPEPATFFLLASGLALLSGGSFVRRRLRNDI